MHSKCQAPTHWLSWVLDVILELHENWTKLILSGQPHLTNDAMADHIHPLG